MNSRLLYFKEPILEFGYSQTGINPMDGLFLYGPLGSDSSPAEIRIGVIGTSSGISKYKNWVSRITNHIRKQEGSPQHRRGYPGFHAVFGAKWSVEPVCEISISQNEILDKLFIKNRHEAIYETVSLFEKKILDYLREEEAHVNLWFIVIPEEVFLYGRPKSRAPFDERKEPSIKISRRRGQLLLTQPSFFAEDNDAAQVYQYHVDFHNQLKARLISSGVVTQIVRETSIELCKQGNCEGRSRETQDPATIAWNLTTACYFKASGRPWKLLNIRDGVCYVGLVFKKDMKISNASNACCGAQMFLDSGEGVVFKGAVGPWYSPSNKEFHLSRDKAEELMRLVVGSYKKKHGVQPRELFIHGKVRFNNDEWSGFSSAVSNNTNLVGVRIRDERGLKLYSMESHPVWRGTALMQSSKKAFLWTRGYIPYLGTYQGREVPNPLAIQIDHGEAELETVLNDIMRLTKINFNRCEYADGLPVTLRFADQIGEILIAAPQENSIPPLPFKHYI